MNRMLALGGVVAALVAGSSKLQAQQRTGPPDIDPEQMRQRMMENFRERLGVTNDAEWKVVEERITKVNEARRGLGGGFGGMGRGAFGRPRGGGDDGANAQAQRPNRGGGGGGFARNQLPEAEELQKALDAKASPDEIKAKLAKLREARKAKQADLAKAQDELRKVLSVRQEAAAVMLGLVE